MDLSYFAGFFDADGSITITRRKNYTGNYVYTLRCFVINTDRRVLEEYKKRFNGGISIAHNFPERKWKTCYRWAIVSAQAKAFLRRIEKFLLIKKSRARLVIEFQELRRKTKTRVVARDNKGHIKKIVRNAPYKKYEAFYNRLKELNKRGL